MLRNANAAASAVAKRVVSDLSQYPSPGDKLHGFTLLRAKHVPELELTALRLRHDKTGADYLHIARDDSNNVFSIGFRTNPADDTGVPHILEHTTLCGSRRYPIRDPFFKMMPRTLSNFMNAFTASDHTFYPFATTNPQDFRNLMSVYLDATLHPLLNRSDFAQEGWRIGPENPQAVAAAAAAAKAAAAAEPEPAAAVEAAAATEAAAKTGGEGSSSTTTTTPPSSLLFKGVVYNEMKGMMSDAGYLFSVRFLDHIFPDIHNSGGDPAKITDLTYEQLARFHREHYHPSNAKLFTYGDMPLEDHLREVDARLGPFEAAPADTTVHLPLDLSSGPREITEPGPVDPLVSANQQFKTSVSWITGDTTDVVESFSLALLSTLLQDGYGSPLYRGLIEAGLGSDWSPNAGYDSSARRGIFTVGLTGVEEANVPKVKHRIRQLLAEARQRGFERQKIDGALHQLEIRLKHKTAKFGLSLLYTLTGRWFTGVDPFDSLAWNDTIAAFEAELAKGGYLERLMDKYLLNDHTLTFTMAPSATFEADVAKEEQERLARKINEAAGKHGTTQVQTFLEEQEIGLLEEQGKTNTEDLSCLPTVYVKDIARSVDPLVVRDDDSAGVDIQWREAPTNGLTYFRALNVLENLPDRLRELIPLFADAIMRLGTKTTTVEQLEDLIKLKTGGVSVGYHCSPSPTDFGQAEEGIMIHGMALDRNVSAMLHLIRTLIVETDFDSPDAPLRIRQLLQASADGLVNDIASSGHGFARGYAEAGLTRAAWLRQQVSGLSQVRLITSLAARPETDRLEDVIANLKQIQLLALAGPKMRAAVTCGASVVADNSASIGSFMAGRPKAPSRSIPLSDAGSRPALSNLKTFFPLPYQVCYGALAVPTVSYTSPDAAPLSLLATALTHKYLHHEIREKGGAYGGGAYSSPVGGLFGLYSYRDPNPVNTLSIMRAAGRWVAEREWPDRDVDQAKIAVFQGVDAPQAVNERGLSRFLCGITEEMKQRRREQLLDATADQIREVARKYLVRDDGPSPADASCRVTFLGKRPQDWVNDESWAVQELDVKGVE